MTALLFALSLDPDEAELIPRNPLSDGDHLVLIAFIAIVGMALGYELFRTWWNTNEWRREARRRRRELQ